MLFSPGPAVMAQKEKSDYFFRKPKMAGCVVDQT